MIAHLVCLFALLSGGGGGACVCSTSLFGEPAYKGPLSIKERIEDEDVKDDAFDPGQNEFSQPAQGHHSRAQSKTNG